ncbi:MAG: PAS domain S-box protein [bacterium]|nr:PAS domain S-box protein [bacterium]
MKLRTKTLLILSGIIAVLIVSLYVATQSILIAGFNRLEDDRCRMNVDRALNAISEKNQAVVNSVKDWAFWDDSYYFMTAADSSFIQKNLLPESFQNIGLNLILYLHANGGVKYGAHYDPLTELLTPIPDTVVQIFHENITLKVDTTGDNTLYGTIFLPEAPMLIAAQTILTSAGAGPSQGTLIFGYCLDSTAIAHLSEVTNLQLNLYRADENLLPADVKSYLSMSSTDHVMRTTAMDADTIAGYTFLRDLSGTPKLILRARMPREIYHEGMAATRYFMMALLLTTLVFGAVVILLLEKFVLSRLAKFSESVMQIGASSQLSARLQVQGKDELAGLGAEINNMLCSIENSDREVRRSSENLKDLIEKLRSNEEMLRSVFQSTPDAIAVTNLDGVILDCNGAVVEAFGNKAKAEIVGRNILEYVPELGHKKLLVTLKTTLKEGIVKDTELMLLRENQSAFPAELSVSYFKNARGEPSNYVFLFSDITLKRRAAMALSHSEERYRLLFERNLAGVFRTTLDGMVLSCNDSFAGLFGLASQKELIGQSILEYYVDVEDREVILSQLREKGVATNFELRFKQRHGAIAWVLGNASLIVGDDEAPLIIQGTMIDITEQKSFHVDHKELLW